MVIEKLQTRHWLLVWLLLALAGYLRFRGLKGQVLLDDEWHALEMVQRQGYAGIFGHFGHADHSIPLTLWFEWLSRTFGLSEWGMRWPSLLAGLALLLIFPALLRNWLRPAERLLLTLLLAVSPLLIFYSRFARPYALLALLVSVALVCAWQWWRACEARDPRKHQSGLASGIGWLGCTVLAAWLNPVSLACTLAPMAIFGLQAVLRVRSAGWGRLARVLSLGGLALLLTGALLYLPLSADWASLAVKSARHYPDLDTALGVLAFFAGTGNGWLMACMAGLMGLGLLELWRREPGLAGYLLAVVLLALAAIALSGAEWSQYALVPARYLVGLLPWFLALVALGAWWLIRALAQRLHLPGFLKPLLAALWVLVLVLGGPLPGWDLSAGQFAHHMANYFDFRAGHNAIAAVFDDYKPDAYYAEIAALHPNGDALVIEAPWYLESFWNPLHLHQQVHGQPTRVGFINGWCAEPMKGEIDAGFAGIRLRHAVQVQELLSDSPGPFYLVLRKQAPPDAWPQPVRIEDCLRRAREQLGPPWRETPRAVVFRRPASSRPG